MRNLQLLHQIVGQDAAESGEEALGTMAVDLDGTIFCRLSSGLHHYMPSYDGHHSAELCWQHVDQNEEWIGMEFLVEQQALCWCTASGDIFVYSTGLREVESVGSISNGLQTMQWSPDQELVVFVTGNETILLMTKDFDPLGEKDLQPEEFGSATPISVGWGSKETQFRGSEGKLSSKVQSKNACYLVAHDDKKPRGRWRDDGQFFVVSSVDPKKGCRVLRIWSREFEHLYTSEDVPGLEHVLDWGPANLIVSTRQHPTKHEVVFFETNGLTHGGFTLPFKPDTFKVREVTWNSDLTLLAIWGHDIVSEGSTSQPYYHVLLYCTKNYHWYLKQSLLFECGSRYVPLDVRWDPHNPLQMHILCQNGCYLQYLWGWTTTRSLGKDSSDQAYVAVIDGDKVLLTPFRRCTIPPPMCAYTIQMDAPISAVAFSSSPGSSNDFALFLADGLTVALCRYGLDGEQLPSEGHKTALDAAGGNGFKPQVMMHSVHSVLRVEYDKAEDVSPVRAMYHCTWLPNGQAFLCVTKLRDNRDALVILDVAHADLDKHTVPAKVLCSMPEGRSIYRVCSSPLGDGTVALQLMDGTILTYDHGSGSLVDWGAKETRFPQPCHTMEVCTVRDQARVFGLSEHGQLCCEGTLIATKCTSFVLHNEFLVYVTQDNKLHCLTLDKDVPAPLNGCALPEDENSVRPVERGSRIVTTVPEDTHVVLQMPRGNLELIHPRPLVLATLYRWLNRCEYKKSIALMRKLRINMNLLYDYNPQKFLDNLETYLEQMESIDWILLFLIELKNENVSQEMYGTHCDVEDAFDNKISCVCNALVNKMESIDASRYLVPIVVAYVKMSNVEDALHKIKDCQDNKSKEQALRQLLCMVDVNELYRIALGTYDFDVVLMVAEKSQKDPREFIPLLNELQKYEPAYRKYKIDVHLRRYKKALQHISQCEGHFDECLDLIKSQKLYTSALHLFPTNSEPYKAIWKAYGEYLREKRYFDEAGLAFRRCQEHSLALQCYRLSLNWAMAMAVAYEMGMPDHERITLARQFAGSLRSSGRYAEAALLYENYVQDPDEGIAVLIEGHEWKQAVLLTNKYGRQAVASDHLKETLLEHLASAQESIQQLSLDFQRLTKRLKLVREQKAAKQAEADVDDAVPDVDVYSDTSSVSGMRSSSSVSGASTAPSGSISTRRTSRRKKKQEKNKYVLKEGSPNEDLALVYALKEIVVAVDKLQEECGSLLETLVLFSYDTEAKSLQHSFGELMNMVQKDITVIWPPENSQESMAFGPDYTTNRIANAYQKQQTCATPTAYTISDPELRTPPVLRKNVEWKLCMLDAAA